MENPSYEIDENIAATKRALDAKLDSFLCDASWNFLNNEEGENAKPLFSVARTPDTPDTRAAYNLYWGAQQGDAGDPAPELVASNIPWEAVIVGMAVGKFVFDRCGFPVAPEKTEDGRTLAQVLDELREAKEERDELKKTLAETAGKVKSILEHLAEAKSKAEDASNDAASANDEADDAAAEADEGYNEANDLLEELRSLSY